MELEYLNNEINIQQPEINPIAKSFDLIQLF
jgi:hypothetical protein